MRHKLYLLAVAGALTAAVPFVTQTSPVGASGASSTRTVHQWRNHVSGHRRLHAVRWRCDPGRVSRSGGRGRWSRAVSGHDRQPQPLGRHRQRRLGEQRQEGQVEPDSSTSGFEGLNLYQQRYARGGNQFTVEPPDQGLCVGNGYVVEAVNDVLNVFNTSGQSVLPDNTATNIVGGFPTECEPRRRPELVLRLRAGDQPHDRRPCPVRHRPELPLRRGDAALLRRRPDAGDVPERRVHTRQPPRHSRSARRRTRPARWNIYRIDVTNDGTNTGGVNPGPYLGDYPHIGADANGFYITTNAYPWCCNGFSGAQIYAFSKAQLAAGAANVTMVHLDTSGMVNAPSDAGSTQPGFTVWPAQSPGTTQFNTGNGGTEYFLSSNAADEATHPVAGTGGNHVSNQLVVWTLTNTSSLNSASPALSLSNKVLSVNQYAIPPKQQQPGSGTPATTDTPQGYCINDTTTAHHRRHRLLAAAVRRPAGPQRGHLDAGLERHPHAAGDVRERQAVGRARHGAQPRRRRPARRHRLVHRQSERRQGRHAGLSRRDRV